MGRLRRRIKLIFADCPEGQSRMTVVRQELPPSRSASRPDRETGRRIVSARALQSCPQRAGADAAQEADAQDSCPPSLSAAYAATAVGCGWVIAAQMNPTRSRAIAATATGGRLPCPTR